VAAQAGRAAGVARRDFLGFIPLAPGVTAANAWVALYASLISIGILNFMQFARPFILLDVLHLPQDAIGRFTGYVGTSVEVLAMAVTLVTGAWADRIGRRALYAAAVLLVGAGYLGMSLVRGTVDFVLYAAVMGAGSAIVGTLLGLVMVDYPEESARGRWVGLNAVLNGVGIIIVAFGLSRLPALLESRGLADTAAMRWSLLVMVAWCMASALILRRGLITGLGPGGPPARVPLAVMLREGVAAAAENRSVLLCYLCFVVSRADLIVVSTYLTLWIQDFARGRGISPTEAIATAGILFGVVQSVALVWGPVFGFLLDRLDRVFCAVLALLVAGIGYVTLGLTADPLAPATYGICVVVGIGQISIILATQSLIGQEAPPGRRGTVMGIASFCGTAAMLLTLFSGGILYDKWMASAPIVVFGALNLAVLLAGLLVWRSLGMPVRRR